MTLRGSAFLALWNDVVPEREDEYNRWHAVEHVPERVGVAGFVSGRRYVLSDGGRGPRYFTLYELESIAALVGPEYAHVVDNPTEWSRSMRPALRNVVRRPCSVAVSLGSGSADMIGVVRLRADLEGSPSRAPPWDELKAALNPLSCLDGIAGLHVGIAVAAATHPLQDRWEDPSWGSNGEIVALVEGRGCGSVEITMRSAVDVLSASFAVHSKPTAALSYEMVGQIERSNRPSSTLPGR